MTNAAVATSPKVPHRDVTMAAGSRVSGGTGDPPSGYRIRIEPERPERPRGWPRRDRAVGAIPRSVTRTDRFVAHDPIDVAAQVGAARGEHADRAVTRAVDNDRIEHGQADRDIGWDQECCRDAGRLFAAQHGDKSAQEGNGQADGEDTLQYAPARRGSTVALISCGRVGLFPWRHLRDSTVRATVFVTDPACDCGRRLPPRTRALFVVMASSPTRLFVDQCA